jgi:hypothetical protein
MFRDRPLTWLFVISTIAVDLVLLSLKGNLLEEFMWSGIVIGQIAALAIWAIRGRMHRMVRASCFVLSTGLLGIVEPTGYFLTFVFVYGLIVLLFALFVEVVRYVTSKETDTDKARKRWQIPLIEFFGWTIVVALVSLGCRYMEFKDVFEDSTTWLEMLYILANPLLLVLFTREDLRDLGVLKAVLFVGVVIALEWNFSYFVIFIQAVYLVAWMIVLTLDNISAETAIVRSLSNNTASTIDEPQLFNPQD